MGLSIKGSTFTVSPCIPGDWPGYKVNYKDGETVYQISVRNPQGVNRGVKQVILDGEVVSTTEIPRLSDGKTHQVDVEMG